MLNPFSPLKWPMSLKIIVSVFFGVCMGVYYGTDAVLGVVHLATLGQLGYLVIKLLKTLAVPLIFFAIVDAIPRTQIGSRHFLRLISICLMNSLAAMALGLFIMNYFQPGNYWATHHADLIAQLTADVGNMTTSVPPIGVVATVSGMIPESIVAPFSSGSVISVVLLALLFGFALRYFLTHPAEGGDSFVVVQKVVESGFHITMKCLSWVIQLVPLAVFGMVAQVVGKSGLEIFRILWVFLAVIIAGLVIHSWVYYPMINWLIGRRSPKEFFNKGAEPIVTALSSNSSLATVPVTLSALRRLKVSDESSRLSVCIGTNFNNDGIALYEAMAALFLLQAFGIAPDIFGQLSIVAVSIVAACGIAGIPEAGLIMLPIVLQSAGFSPGMIALAIPLIVPVDWIIARCRSMVNVMSDMTVAIVLNRFGDGSK